jgi:polyisoprenoid-binding protein YceI
MEGQHMISTSKATLVPAGAWAVDPAHSTVGFSVKHLGIATVRGRFDEFEGTLEVGEGDASARVYGSVQGVSVNTGHAGRDEHLRSAEFFGVEANPSSASSRPRSTSSTRTRSRWWATCP